MGKYAKNFKHKQMLIMIQKIAKNAPFMKINNFHIRLRQIACT